MDPYDPGTQRGCRILLAVTILIWAIIVTLAIVCIV